MAVTTITLHLPYAVSANRYWRTVVITEPRIEDVEQSPQGVLAIPVPLTSREAQTRLDVSEPLAF